MQYFGGKQRIAKPLSKYINSILIKDQPFFDLFCGSCNVINLIDNNRQKYANDMKSEIIALWEYLQGGGELPDSISEDEYKDIKDNRNNHSKWLLAFVGFGGSFAGKYFGGFARGNTGRNYISESKRSCEKKLQGIKHVIFSSKDYKDVQLSINKSLIYCDIPYKGTTQYSTGNFDHDRFYKWAIDTSKNHDVLVSEYKHNVPDGWEVVWEISSKKSVRNKLGECIDTVEILMRPINDDRKS